MPSPMLWMRTESKEHGQTGFCHWCVRKDRKRAFFKVRDGPVDWLFCDMDHAELWLHYRHKPETYQLCRMLPPERLEYLQGRSMEDEISRLFPEVCDVNE